MVETCLNCGQPIERAYCGECGQKNKENSDRSLRRLIGEVVTNVFFFDNRLWVSLRYLFLKPGQMTREYLEGKRRKFISPISIFLFANLLYFFTNPITDYSLPLYDQLQRQTHSAYARKLVQERLATRDITMEDYTQTYNAASLNLSKSVMILNVPLLALFLWPAFARRSRFYYDTLIFSLHYFTLFLLGLVVGKAVHELTVAAGVPMPDGFMLVLVGLVLPFVYGVLSTRIFARYKWVFCILVGIAIMLSLFLAQFFYRALIFFLTFAFT